MVNFNDGSYESIVIDGGGFCMRSGFAGEDTPRSLLQSSSSSTPLNKCVEVEEGMMSGNNACGEMIKRGPIERRRVVSWDDMEMIWQYTFSHELKINSNGRGILLSEAPLIGKEDRLKTTEIMFEKFGFQSLYLENQAALSLYACGRVTGLVLDSGESVTDFVPVYEGRALPHATMRLDFGGSDLTEYMMKMMSNKGSIVDKEIARKIKETMCHVALDYQAESNSGSSLGSIEKPFELPDGSVVTVDCERFKCPELLFQPQLFGLESGSVIETLCNTILKCDLDIRADFRANIVLSGGSTMFEGIEKRISKDLIELLPEYKYKIKVAPPVGSNTVWIGGSMMASLSTCQSWWLTDAEYQEEGPGIVFRKFY